MRERGDPVPLSENEQRQLEAIERALYADDPKFAAALNGRSARSVARRRLVIFGLVDVVGAVLLAMTFVNLAFGLAGILVMFLGTLGVIAAVRQLSGRARPTLGVVNLTGTVRPPQPHKTSTWAQRLEQRWERRWEDRGH